MPVDDSWIEPTVEDPAFVDADVYVAGAPLWGESMIHPSPPETWYWQVLPDGLIYHAYQAGVHESRMALVTFGEGGSTLWDATLGGRAGMIRYGDGRSIFPQGWQLDIEGAAIVRLNLEEQRDVESTDFRFGIPLTYGIDNWQFKFAYYHLSSHLGDERAIRVNPPGLGARINYVRDAWVLGVSYYPHPIWRLYAEGSYAFHYDGGAEPWEFQFGTELSRPGVTGPRGTPFLAINGHIRDDVDFGGDLTAQAGWLWRGCSGQTMRIGAHYFNGKSSQYETFDNFEQQIGFGLWYDF